MQGIIKNPDFLGLTALGFVSSINFAIFYSTASENNTSKSLLIYWNQNNLLPGLIFTVSRSPSLTVAKIPSTFHLKTVYKSEQKIFRVIKKGLEIIFFS